MSEDGILSLAENQTTLSEVGILYLADNRTTLSMIGAFSSTAKTDNQCILSLPPD